MRLFLGTSGKAVSCSNPSKYPEILGKPSHRKYFYLQEV